MTHEVNQTECFILLYRYIYDYDYDYDYDSINDAIGWEKLRHDNMMNEWGAYNYENGINRLWIELELWYDVIQSGTDRDSWPTALDMLYSQGFIMIMCHMSNIVIRWRCNR